MNTTKFETGATSHAVNDLILFSDNTSELAKKRDSIYRLACEPGIYMANLKINGPTKAHNTLVSMFSALLRDAIKRYIIEFPTSNDHVKDIRHWDEQGQEFCQLYAQDFENWKFEHGYK